MNTIKELISQSADLLKNRNVTNTNYLKPHYPVVVVYYGTRSSGYHNALMKDLSNGWGGNADYVLFYCIDPSTNDKEYTVIDLKTNLPINDIEIKKSITRLLSQSDAFADPSYIALYCVMDTNTVKCGEEFRDWYLFIEKLKEIIGTLVFSMLLVILDQSLNVESTAKAIRKELMTIYKDVNINHENEHAYDSVFILGNRRKDGGYSIIEPHSNGHSSFNLFSDIILLSNTEDTIEYSMRRESLYNSCKPAFTAAYNFVQKPMKEIVMIALSVLINKLKDLSTNQAMDGDALAKSLSIKNGSSEQYEKVYDEIVLHLPSAEFINWLPGSVTHYMTYKEANIASYGCLQCFIETEHYSTIDKVLKERNDDIIEEYSNNITSSFNAAQLYSGITTFMKERTLSQAEITITDDNGEKIDNAISSLVKQRVSKQMRINVDKALNSVQDSAKRTVDEFRILCNEFEKVFAIGEEGLRRNLKSFYIPMVERSFGDTAKLSELLNRTLKIGNAQSDMLDILLNTLKKLFESDAVYKLSFFDELVKRLGKADNDNEAKEMIRTELNDKLDSRVQIYTNSVFTNRVLEAYFLNSDDASNNLLSKYLRKLNLEPGTSRTFFNTASRDMAESVWIYTCTEDNLLL